jgi:ribosomal protein S12 methylthiotransferase accessory factor
MEKNQIIPRKRYKAVPPQETISRIKSILNQQGIETIEENSSSGNGDEKDFRYCRIFVKTSPVFSAGGKGMTEDYARASGYGELIERIQNNLVFPLKEDVSFKNAVDEQSFSTPVLLRENREVVDAIFGEEAEDEVVDFFLQQEGEQMIGIPYFDVFNKTVRYLPDFLKLYLNLFNGNCAGNTVEEALIHGICEVMERYVIKQIYFQEMRLPTIASESFAGTEIFDRIRFLEESLGFHIKVKDCSIGMGLPVIGVLITDPSNLKYSFQLGCDPSPEIALERCLTEIFQDDRIFSNYIHYGEGIFENDEEKIRLQQRCKEFVETNNFARGKWPDSIFEEPEVVFFRKGDTTQSASDTEDLKHLLDLLKGNGFQLYVRDVSYLGFPSYNIYVPGMSEYFEGEPFSFYVKYQKFLKLVPALRRLKQNSPAQQKEIAYQLDDFLENPEPFIPFEISRFYSEIDPQVFEEINNNLFAFMLHYRIGDLKKAVRYINRFVDEYPGGKCALDGYYWAIRDCVKMKAKGFSDSKIEKDLGFLYGADTADEVLEDLKHPEEIFKYFDLPSCPDCDDCSLRNRCCLKREQKVINTLTERQQEWFPKQDQLLPFFNSIQESNECIVE